MANFWNSRYGEPTDAGALGTEKCVLFARVMELVDVPDSKSGGVTRAGSSPALGTICCNKRDASGASLADLRMVGAVKVKCVRVRSEGWSPHI